MEPKTLKARLIALREERRLDRQFGVLSKSVPGLGAPLRAVRPGGFARMFRVPVAGLLVLGGLFSFLPVLGIWMLPLGLLLLAVDVPALRRPVSAFTIRGRRFAQKKWRRVRPSIKAKPS